MIAPQTLLDNLAAGISRLQEGTSNLPRPELEQQVKGLLQSAFGRLDLVSRDEFEAQALVLSRTRERLEALEKQVAALEEKLSATD